MQFDLFSELGWRKNDASRRMSTVTKRMDRFDLCSGLVWRNIKTPSDHRYQTERTVAGWVVGTVTVSKRR